MPVIDGTRNDGYSSTGLAYMCHFAPLSARLAQLL